MPGGLGSESVKELRKAGYNKVIIGVSGYSDVLDFMSSGLESFISKPLNLKKLSTVLESCRHVIQAGTKAAMLPGMNIEGPS